MGHLTAKAGNPGFGAAADAGKTPAPADPSPVRGAFRRQLLIGALALATVVFATLVLLMEVRLNEEVEARYQQALAIAQQALEAHQLSSVSAAVAARAAEATEHSRFLNRIARYTLGLAMLLSVSFGAVLAVLTWRSHTTRREVMGALDRMAREDGLTGITNRRGLDEGLAIELARARRTGESLTVVMLDLDHFKRFNDRRGHVAGDQLLRGAAQAWRRQLRPTDVLARYGGEEFTLVLPSCDADAGCQLVERLRPHVPERQTFSAGVAVWEHHESPEQLLARADRALLLAKKEGRNRTVVSGREPQMALPLRIA